MQYILAILGIESVEDPTRKFSNVFNVLHKVILTIAKIGSYLADNAVSTNAKRLKALGFREVASPPKQDTGERREARGGI